MSIDRLNMEIETLKKRISFLEEQIIESGKVNFTINTIKEKRISAYNNLINTRVTAIENYLGKIADFVDIISNINVGEEVEKAIKEIVVRKGGRRVLIMKKMKEK